MYAIIRHYQTGAGSIDHLMHKVDAEFADHIPQQVASVLYQAIDTGDGTVMTVMLFENEEAGRRSEGAAAGVRERLGEFQVEQIEIFAGEVMVSRAHEKLLSPIRH